MKGREYLTAKPHERREALTRMWPASPANVNAVLAMPDNQAATLLDQVESERRNDQRDYDTDGSTIRNYERGE